MYVYIASGLWLCGQPSGGARRLRQIILPSFLLYHPRPSLSPPFDLRIFRFLRARERGRGFEAMALLTYMYTWVGLQALSAT